MNIKFKSILIALIAFLIATSGYTQSEKEDEYVPLTDSMLFNAMRAAKGPNLDVHMEIVKNLLKVKAGRMSPEKFYKKVAKLDMPPGKELRHVLMEVKKDVGNWKGERGLRFVFGDIYASGATVVESKILTYRREIVMETIKDSIKEFKRAHPELAKTFTFYYGEVGGWPNESFDELKFAGDIDFNFLSGNLEAAMLMKKIFDKRIIKKFGRTPEEIDIPCTVHGMATSEVYVGKHGQAFAEAVTKHAWLIDFDSDLDGLGKDTAKTPFADVLTKMVAEAKMPQVMNGIDNLGELKWPNQPGISLEMIRHFEHDIVGQNVYTDLESFVKAAKYADRSFTFLEEDLGEAAIKNKTLRQFTHDLVEAKKNPKKLVELIEDYYKAIGEPLPMSANFEITEGGKSKATIEMNEQLIRAFWDVCRKTMWESANVKIRKVIDEMKAKIADLRDNDGEKAKEIYDELKKYHEMLEIENKILTDDKAGVHEHLDDTFVKLMTEFRGTVKAFKEKVAKNDLLKYIDPEASKTFKWVEEMLKGEGEFNVRMAWAGIDATISKTNDILDYFDDKLMNKLRYGDQGDYVKYLRNDQNYSWGEQAQKFLGNKIKLSTDYSAALDRAQTNIGEIRGELTRTLNLDLEKMCNTRGVKLIKTVGGGALGAVQTANNTFNESLGNSRVGGAMMKTMMVYNLADEIPLYMNKVYEGDLDGLAAEFFRRRVPFGGAVERGVMGDYYGVAWELTATLLPPAAIVSAAKNIGESIATGAIDTYFDEEFEKFIDSLYEDATFKILSVEQVGQDIKVTDWALLAVSYQGKEFKYDDLISMEIADAREMAECLQRPSRKRPDCFPMEKMSNGLFEWWGSRDAFETKFKKTDPWLQLIKEMEEHPSAGRKLQDHYRYQKYTRLEQIKVDFLKKLKTQLEERRAGEEAIISGQFTQMYDRLLTIADELDIRLQLENTIYEEFGGGVVQFMTWLKDYVRGEIRALQGEADVWDVYEQLSAFVTKNLKVYDDVIGARTEAEANLTTATVDQGLRILTGPYFLTGKAEVDQAAAKKWKKVPKDVYKETRKILAGIKKDSDADPSALDLNAGAYDKSILDQIVYHDAFRAMWKQVNSTFVNIQKSAYFVGSDFEKEGVESYLGNEPSTQTKPNRRGMSDQDRALKRFKLHTERTAELIEGFKKHYKKTEEAEERDTRQAEDEATAAVGALDNLLTRIEALYAQADAQIESLEDQVDQLEDTTKEYEDETEEIIEKVETEIGNIHAASTINLTQLVSDMQRASERLARARDDIEMTTLNVCQAYETMQSIGSVAKADQLLQSARSDMQRVTRIYNDAQSAIRDMNYYKGQAEQATNKYKNAQALIAQAKALAARGDTLHGQAEGLVGRIDGMKEFNGQVNAIVTEAEEIFQNADTDEAASRDHKRALKKLNRTYKKIMGRADKVRDVVNDGEGLKGDLNYVLFNARAFGENLNAAIAQLEQIGGTQAVVADEALKADVMSHYEAGMLFADSVKTAYANAKTCLSGVAREHGAYATPARREAQADCSKYPGSTPKWNPSRGVVECQCMGGKIWDDYTKSCMTRQAIVGDTNCSKYGANAEAYWNYTQNAAWCRCKSGYEMISNYCVQKRQRPAHDPYDRGGYGGGNNNSGSDYGADDFVNDVTGIIQTIQGGKTNNTGYQGNSGGYNNSGYGSKSGGCERNFTLTYSGGAYGSQGFKCNCPGWGFDPSRSRCMQGMDDRYDTTPKKKPSGITTNKSRSTYQKPNTSGGSSSSSSGSYGGGYVDCSQTPDVCSWSGGSNLFGVPGLDCVPIYCRCGCDTAPDHRCASMPRPENNCY